MLIEYLSGLYTSDINTSLDRQIYNKYNISIVINLTQLDNFVDLNIKKTRIPISNDLNFHTDIKLLNNNMINILSYIHNNLITNNILVVCNNGLTISPIIIGLYISKYGNISLNNIRDILKSKNKNICIDLNLNIFTIN